MLKKRTMSDIIFDTINTVLLLIITFACFYPIIHIVMASLSSPNELMAHSGLLFWPLNANLESYVAAFKHPRILPSYLNTLFIVVSGVCVNLVLTTIGAYFLSRKNVLFKNVVMIMIIITMYFSGGLVPIYLTVKGLGMLDTYWALIIPGAINTFNLIMMRTYFMSLPDSLEESARLDGAGHLTILTRIILPVSGPIVAVITLYYAVGHWNSWFNAMIYLKDSDKFPLQLVLREILINNDMNNMTSGVQTVDKEPLGETIKYAIIVIATVPILLIYPFLQKYFVKGVMVGALKG